MHHFKLSVNAAIFFEVRNKIDLSISTITKLKQKHVIFMFLTSISHKLHIS